VLRDEAVNKRELAPRRDGRGTLDMIGSGKRPPILPISVDVLSIDTTAGLAEGMSCFITAESLEAPRDVVDMSDARLVRPDLFGSLSARSMAARLLPLLSV